MCRVGRLGGAPAGIQRAFVATRRGENAGDGGGGRVRARGCKRGQGAKAFLSSCLQAKQAKGPTSGEVKFRQTGGGQRLGEGPTACGGSRYASVMMMVVVLVVMGWRQRGTNSGPKLG